MRKSKRSIRDDESSEEKPVKRYRVTRACTNCQKAHVSCVQYRPCKRCIEKGISDTCVDGIQRKRGKKKKNAPEVTEQSAYEHEWYHARSAEPEPVMPLDWSAVATSIPVPAELSRRRSYTFVHFDPETGDYVEDSSSMISPEMYDTFWLDTSQSSHTAASSPANPISPFGGITPQSPFGFGLPRASFVAEVTKDDADVLLAAAETAEAEEQVKREIFRQSFDLTDQGHYDPVFVPSSPDIWGRMREAVEAAHSHDPHGRRASFHFVAPMPTGPAPRRAWPEFDEKGEGEGDNDAPFLLWRLSHDHGDGRERPLPFDPPEHIKV